MRNVTELFPTITEQNELQLVIILNIINPKLGGLLIQGVKKSENKLIKDFINAIIPPIDVMEYCEYNCNPELPDIWCSDCREQYKPCNAKYETRETKIISIPNHITEKELLGYIKQECYSDNVEIEYIPGLLARAHRQVLYINELHQLPQQIINRIFRISACGWNHFQPEGIAIDHPSEFILMATIDSPNRNSAPWLNNQFPLSINIIDHNFVLEETEPGFYSRAQEIKEKIQIARNYLDNIKIKPDYIKLVKTMCSNQGIDGDNIDITIRDTAKTYAAFQAEKEVKKHHLMQALRLALPHHTRKQGKLPPLTPEDIEALIKDD